MPKTKLPITSGYYESESLPISSQRCVNFFPNTPQTESSTDAALFHVSGIKEVIDLSILRDISRGSHNLNGKPYFLIGQTLSVINQTFDTEDNEVLTAESIGVVEGTGPVFMADNGDQLCIVAKPESSPAFVGKSYIFDEAADTFKEITDGNFDGPASGVRYIDGLFVFAKDTGTKFFNSPLKDGRGAPDGPAYDPLDFSQAEADPDDIAALGTARSQLYVLGTKTTEIFRNTGRSPAPFVRLQGAVIDVGIVSPLSLQEVSGGLAFIGSTENEGAAVWGLAGARKSKISTIAIDKELLKLTNTELKNITSWYYSEIGHFFYGITLPNTTFVYDFAEKKWHERQSVSGEALTKYRVANMTEGYGRIFAGDNQGGKIGEINRDTFTEYNTLIRRLVTTKPFDNLGDSVIAAQVEAVVDNGVGLSEDASLTSGFTVLGVPIVVTGGSDPQITLFWSDDGGRTFKGGLSRSMGKIGEYKKRQIWRRLGRFPRSRVLKLEITSPTKSTIIKLEADIRG